MNIVNRKKTLVYILISTITVFLIIFSWFKSGSIISNSEESLSIYNPSKIANLNITVWYSTETGTRVPFGITKAYPFLILSYLAKLGVPAYLNQALLIGTSMLVALISTYLLFTYLSGRSFLVSFIGSFFYLLNLYSQSQVFRRHQYNLMFAFAYYPLFLFLWIKAIDSNNLKFLLFFLGSSVLFSYSFSHPASLVAFSVSILIVTLIQFWKVRKFPRKLITTISFSLASCILFILVNIWWIYPLTTSGGDYLSSIENTSNSDLTSLQAVSKSFPLSEILLLRQQYWYGPSQHWYTFYQHPIIYVISIIIIVLVILGLKKTKSSPFWLFLISLLIIGLFISKGTNPPAGFAFFYFLFNHFPFFGAMRNSYEKFGIVFLLPFSFMFAYGLSHLINKMKGRKNKILTTISVLIVFEVLLVWPMWTGDVFNKSELVKVPNYYSQANNFLNEQNDSRILHLPLSQSYDEKYDWGFHGQDPSEYLFDRTSLSNTLLLPLRNLFYKQLPTISGSKNFPNLLGFLGVGNIVVHYDSINEPKDNLMDINVINSWEGIKKVTDIGKLTIYEINPAVIRSRFYGINLEGPNILDYKTRTFPDVSILEDKFTNFNYQKLGQNYYRITINKAQKPFILIFNETFDHSWTAQINSQIIPNHFKTYGLVNGWLIQKSGDLTIEVKFKLWPWD